MLFCCKLFSISSFSRSLDPNARIVFLANHQSTGDVPYMMQALMRHPSARMMWIMDQIFIYTPFGVVSKNHGDYFLDCYHYKSGNIYKHTRNHIELGKNLFILFPEGKTVTSFPAPFPPDQS